MVNVNFVGRRAVWNAAVIILLDAKAILYIKNVNTFIQFIRNELCKALSSKSENILAN